MLVKHGDRLSGKPNFFDLAPPLTNPTNRVVDLPLLDADNPDPSPTDHNSTTSIPAPGDPVLGSIYANVAPCVLSPSTVIPPFAFRVTGSMTLEFLQVAVLDGQI